ncbi:MAG: ribonuclease E/G, partial [Veillonella sp.]|nr:ribonuclease E/G [Veillonella sp.]
LRLRDIGGIIICDFIDMREKKHQQELLDLLSKLAKQDRMKTVVCGLTQLGLVEMTRKRARQGIRSIVFDTCPQCGGTGAVLSAYSVYLQIVRRLRELKAAGRLRSDMEITVHPQVAACFTKQVLKDLEGELSRHIEVASDATMSVEGYSLLALNV